MCAINNTDVCPNHLCVCGSLDVIFSSSCVTVKFKRDRKIKFHHLSKFVAVCCLEKPVAVMKVSVHFWQLC